MELDKKSWDSSVDIAGQLDNWGLNPRRDWKFFSLTQCPDPPSLLSNGYWDIVARV
jgi:hypothetical protein